MRRPGAATEAPRRSARRGGRGAAAAAALALVLVPVAACGEDTDDGSTAGTATTPSLSDADVRPLPPNDPSALARIYDPVLEPLGVRVTRASLVDRTGGAYEVADDGRHLALYVEPTGEYTDQQFLDGVWDLASLVTPDVFARYTEIESYDICQEPLPADDDRPEPPPMSQIDVDRATAESIDWEGGTLVDLIEASQRGRLLLRVDDSISALPGWVEASQEAAARVMAG